MSEFMEQVLREENARLDKELSKVRNYAKELDNRIHNALKTLGEFGAIDGEDAKAYAIDSAVGSLCGTQEAHREWVRNWEKGCRDGEEWPRGSLR